MAHDGSVFENEMLAGELAAERQAELEMPSGIDATLLAKAAGIVTAYIHQRLDKTDPVVVFETYIVWFCKTLKNWKALVSTTLPDGMYYEVTYNGDKEETYLDAYKKFDNVRVPD